MEKIKITSLQDAEQYINFLLQKMKEMEEREPIRDTGLVEEIIYLRQETRIGFENIDNRFLKLEGKMDENTRAIKSLDKRFVSLDKRFDSLDKRFGSLNKQVGSLNKQVGSLNKQVGSLESTMKGGFDNVGKVLQEISNKLD